MSEEMFDVVDQEDRVLFQSPRSVVHANHWLHRAVHIFVFNSRGELLIHRRSATKDEAPLKYTSSASGHLSAGEDYAIAAVRELEEELGLKADVEFLGIGEVARIDTNLLNPLCSFHGGVWLEMDVGDQRNSTTKRIQLFPDLP
jgi:isopentenyldiphosphate isomerase